MGRNRASVELFEAIRREYEFGAGTVQGVARKFGVHRRLVREALESAVPAGRKVPERGRPVTGPLVTGPLAEFPLGARSVRFWRCAGLVLGWLHGQLGPADAKAAAALATDRLRERSNRRLAVSAKSLPA